MQLCPDPLETVRSIGHNQQWCVTLPACYPTIFPYIPTNVEYNGQQAPNTGAFNIDVNNYDCTNIIDSSLCANNELVQRIRRKIDLYQTSPLIDARQTRQHLKNIVKQHVPEGDVRGRVNPSSQLQSNTQQDVLLTSSSVATKTRSPSLLQQIVDRKITDERVLPTDSSHQSHLSDSSLRSTNLSTYSNQTNEDSSRFSPTPSLQSSSQDNENNSDQIGSESNTVLSPSSSDHNDRASIGMSIPVPSISSTSHFSKQPIASDQLRQTAHDMMSSSSHQNDHHLSNDRIISAIDLKSSSSLSPSHDQQRVDRILSLEQATSTVPSPTGYTSDFRQQDLLTPLSTSTYSNRSPSIKSQHSDQTQHTLGKSNANTDLNGRKKDYQHRLSKEIGDNKIKKQNSWFKKLRSKIPSKYLNPTSFHDSSPENISHMYINDYLHMKEAMPAVELDLTKEAFQALIDKKKDSQQNRLMRILTTPSRCCRSCRTQRHLATVAQRSIDIAIKNIQIT